MTPLDLQRRLFLGSAVGALALRPSRADTTFTNFSFAATGAPTARTMPDRLSDLINVKDWGAAGDGRDDHVAIQAAIDYCISRGGGKVFFPPGRYALGTNNFLNVGSSSADAGVELIGNGQILSTSIVGNYAGFLVSKGTRTYDNIQCLDGMSIINGDATVGSGALKVTGSNVGIRNCYLQGMVLIDASLAQGCTIFNCGGKGNDPVGAANSTYPKSTKGVAFYLGNNCTAINCRVVGDFWIVYAVSGTGASLIGCSSETVTIGCRMGWSPSGEKEAVGCTLQSFQTERCYTSVELYNCRGCLIQGCFLSCTVPPPITQTVTNMTWDSGSHLVTVTVGSAHNLPVGTTAILLDVTGIGIPFPAGSWRENYFTYATRLNATQFTYPGPATNPGAFPGANWTYSAISHLACRIVSDTAIISSVIGANVSLASVDLDYNGTGEAAHNNNVFIGNNVGSYNLPTDVKNLAGWYFDQVGSTTVPWNSIGQTASPRSKMVFANLPGQTGVLQNGPIEGQEYDIIDGRVDPGGGAAVWDDKIMGGGSGHYKVRYDATRSSWRRIG
jgi:Pectate lyase superfamily protein